MFSKDDVYPADKGKIAVLEAYGHEIDINLMLENELWCSSDYLLNT